MKRLLLLPILLIALLSNAQNKIDPTGNVGIGTLKPGAKLDVNGVIRTYNKDNTTATWDNLNIWSEGTRSFIQSNGDENGLFIKSNGGNRIVLESPTSIRGSLKVGRISFHDWYNPLYGYSNSALIMNGTRSNNKWVVHGDGARSTIGIITTDILANMRFVIHRDDSFSGGKQMTDDELIGNNTKMIINRSGAVGIGTTSPSAKLDVNGNIKAHEIAVTLASIDDIRLNGTLAANNITYTTNGNTADFVFEPTYHLRELSEVEAFINNNQHLPDIPSAAAMEESGVNLAEMNKLLLMKIEELTLYAIDKEKRVEDLEKEVKEVRREESEARREKDIKLMKFEERLAQLEALILDRN